MIHYTISSNTWDYRRGRGMALIHIPNLDLDSKRSWIKIKHLAMTKGLIE